MSLSNMTHETESLDHVSFYETVALNKQVHQPVIYNFSKRTLDILLALIGLIFLSPLFVILGLIIKLEDPKGPVFFKQKRVGKDGQPFMMIKFRSMVSNAELLLNDLLSKNEISGNMFKMKEDPRITRVGKLIRKTSIDELPQLNQCPSRRNEPSRTKTCTSARSQLVYGIRSAASDGHTRLYRTLAG